MTTWDPTTVRNFRVYPQQGRRVTSQINVAYDSYDALSAEDGVNSIIVTREKLPFPVEDDGQSRGPARSAGYPYSFSLSSLLIIPEGTILLINESMTRPAGQWGILRKNA